MTRAGPECITTKRKSENIIMGITCIGGGGSVRARIINYHGNA